VGEWDGDDQEAVEVACQIGGSVVRGYLDSPSHLL
jgi:hypothetical protein